MALENKLGITDSAALAREEEKISKKKALEVAGYSPSSQPEKLQVVKDALAERQKEMIK